MPGTQCCPGPRPELRMTGRRQNRAAWAGGGRWLRPGHHCPCLPPVQVRSGCSQDQRGEPTRAAPAPGRRPQPLALSLRPADPISVRPDPGGACTLTALVLYLLNDRGRLLEPSPVLASTTQGPVQPPHHLSPDTGHTLPMAPFPSPEGPSTASAQVTRCPGTPTTWRGPQHSLCTLLHRVSPQTRPQGLLRPPQHLSSICILYGPSG